ncbi:hypothetical protein OIU83_22005 [Flavobacterium sp. LS1R49]|uniref:Uncharacterized protein n=1 Tax=Flavobacterium shii TaxID=2987687 RepID=A0A9X2YXW0_9FLAO|nr:hypothetical protein [Flavobacterium shii]MCV9930349.1 hypothetical protein [Flavobacterium shii]
MKTLKMSLANAQGKLSRIEMKTIMAGSGGFCPEGYFPCNCNGILKGCYDTASSCFHAC